MPQFKVLRVYIVEADNADGAAHQLRHWLTSLQAREMFDVRLVFESAKPAEEKEGAFKAVAKTARDKIAGPGEADHQAA